MGEKQNAAPRRVLKTDELGEIAELDALAIVLGSEVAGYKRHGTIEADAALHWIIAAHRLVAAADPSLARRYQRVLMREITLRVDRVARRAAPPGPRSQ